MKRTLARFVLPTVLLSVTALAQTGSAAPTPAATTTGSTAATSKVGIINIQQAILLTNEGKRDLEALDKKFEPQRSTLQNLQKEVQGMQDQLKTQGDKLNEEARAKLVRDIETRQKSLQRQLEDAQGEYQGAQGELVNRIGGKLMEVLDKYAKSNGYSMILDVSNPQSPVLWASAPIDVTQEIATAYNASSNVPAPAASTTPSAPSAQRPAGGLTRPAAAAGTKPATSATTPK
jgi:outer membrane protein